MPSVIKFVCVDKDVRKDPLIREFTKRRRLRQRQRQKAVIQLVKRTKIVELHVRHAFLARVARVARIFGTQFSPVVVKTTTWNDYI